MSQSRGKRVDGEGWVKGHHFVVGAHHYITTKDARVLPLGYTDGPPCLEGFVEVIPKSVGQSTGMEKNKIEIYEGDCFRGRQTGTLYTVIFKDGEFILVYDSVSPPVKEWKHSSLHYAIYNTDIILIGNTTDDPEILEDKP